MTPRYGLKTQRIYNPNEGNEVGVVLGLFPNDIVAVFVISA